MAWTTATRGAAALAITALGNSISVHTGDPGTTGANEASGGSYARVPTTWAGSAVAGKVTGSDVNVNLPAGTFTHIGIWNGGTFVGGQAISSFIMSSSGTRAITPSVSVAA
jgi:hypothetical protein